MAGRGGHRFGHSARPRGERLELEGPHWPVPEDGSRPADPLGEIGRGVAADVEPHPALGHVDAVQQTDLCVRVELPPEAQVLGQLQDRVASLGLFQHVSGGLHSLLLDQRVAGVPAIGLEEAEAHRTADQNLLSDPEEAIDNTELVGDLGAAEHDNEGTLRVFPYGTELHHLLLEQQPGVAGQVVGDTLGTGMSAVR